jgi:cytochrome c oxidase subunit IV
MSSHVVPKSTYYSVYVALLVLLVLTVVVREFHLGEWNLVAALVIAVVKTVLIVLFFMHIRYERGVPRLFAVAGILWLMLLIGLTMSDVLTRQSVESSRREIRPD